MTDEELLRSVIASDTSPADLRLQALLAVSAREEEQRRRTAEREQAQTTLKHDKLKLWLNAPFIVAATGLVTIFVTFFLDINKIDKTTNNAVELEKRKFQLEIIKSALNENKSQEDRASALLFFVDTGILDGLNQQKLREWSTEKRDQIPGITSDTVGVEREAPKTEADQAFIERLKLKAAETRTSRWMDVALNEIGVTEIVGPDSNARIMQYARDVGINVYKNDETPWSGLFLVWVLKQARFSNFPAQPLSNRDWSTWGTDQDQPSFGSIGIFAREPNSVLSYAGFIIDSDDSTVSILMGNVNNAVGVARLPRSALLKIRKPA